MESVDQQFRQLKENYERMTEGELYACAEKAYELTEIAREALQAVITERGFDVQLNLERPAPRLTEPPEDDEGLINFKWLTSVADAWRVMGVLTAAGIPSYLGPDNVMHLEEFRGKFDKWISLKVRDVDRDRAWAAWRAAGYWDDDEEDDDPDEEKDYAILCPKCRSAKVVMAGGDTEDMEKSPPRDKFQWSCDACGHQWSDEGIEQEVPAGKEEEGSGEEHS